MARDKNDKTTLLEALRNPDLWIVWVDDEDQTHHTLRSLAATIPPGARVAKSKRKD